MTSDALRFQPGSTHPLFDQWHETWRKLAHVYEGSGGFLNGGYLQAHPREWLDHTSANPSQPTAKLKERRRLARYENVAAPIIDQKVAALFREGPTRTVKQDVGFLDWCENMDGNGVSLTDFMRDAFREATIFGHTYCVLDREKTATRPETMADVRPPYLITYAPLSVPDWLDDRRGRITAVKLLEEIPRESLTEAATTDRYQVRIVDANGWRESEEAAQPKRNQPKSTWLDEGAHGFGRIPVVPLFAKRRSLIAVIGASVLHDPQLYIDLYNLTSELRELLRRQTFGVLNVPLGVGPDAMSVDQAKTLIGESVGTTAVLFSGLPASYVSPDPLNVVAYQTERRDLIRMIYRLCSVPWEADSKDAEAEGSLKLKREDMNQILAGYGDECERAEYEIAELWFRGRFGPDKWRAAYEAAGVTIQYPDKFDVDSFADLLEQATAADGLGLKESKTFALELATRTVPRFLPNVPVDTMTTIHEELKARQTPEERRQAGMERMARAFAVPDSPTDEEPPTSAAAAIVN